jgi:prefoldin subunit 5
MSTTGKKTKITEAQLLQMAKQEEHKAQIKQEEAEQYAHLVGETRKVKETLTEMKKANGKVFINIGATIMVEVEAKEIKKCKRGFAEKVYIDEDVDDTIAWLTKKEEQFTKKLEVASKEYSEIRKKLSTLMGLIKQVNTEKKKYAEKMKNNPPTISK